MADKIYFPASRFPAGRRTEPNVDSARVKPALQVTSCLYTGVEAWRNITTDPNKHDPNSFLYVVHALRDPVLRVFQTMQLGLLRMAGEDISPE